MQNIIFDNLFLDGHMNSSRTETITKKQVRDLLSNSECLRVPSLDISGGMFESYQLPDGRVLVDFSGEGGTIYESRDELENWLRETQIRQDEFIATLPKSYMVPAESFSTEELEKLDISEHYSDQSSSFAISDENYSSIEMEDFELSASDKSYVTKFVQYFRPLGFYQEYQELSNDDLAEKLAELWKTEAGQPFDISDPYIDLDLLQWDFMRVWWQDSEADVCMGNEIYAATLERWENISRGVFPVRNVAESWSTHQGPIQVDFTLKNQTYHIQPNYMGDWIDLNILRQINPLILNTNYQFEMVQTGSQIAFVTTLMEQEKQKIQSERNWIFLT